MSHTAQRTPRHLLVSVPEYWHMQESVRTFDEFAKNYDRMLYGHRGDLPTVVGPYYQSHMSANKQRGPLGLWCITRLDETGFERLTPAQQARERENPDRILSQLWAKNVITDNGASAMLKNTWNYSGSGTASPGLFSYIAITPNIGSSYLTASISNGQLNVTTLSVAALPATIPATTGGSATTVSVSYGTSNAEIYTLSATAAQLATSESVTSQTAGKAHAILDNVVPQPVTAENPSTMTNAVYSAPASTTWTYSGAGAGNRQVTIAYTFPTSSTPGNYTEAWTCNSVTPAANFTASHITFPPQALNANTSGVISIIERC